MLYSLIEEILQFIDNHPLISVIWIALFFNLIFNMLQNIVFKVKNITCTEAIYLINKKNALIIDIRNIKDYHKGHIASSYNLPVSNYELKNLNKVIEDKAKHVIIVCSNGNVSKYIAKKLKKNNFKYIYFIEEGILGWNRKNLPLVKK